MRWHKRIVETDRLRVLRLGLGLAVPAVACVLWLGLPPGERQTGGRVSDPPQLAPRESDVRERHFFTATLDKHRRRASYGDAEEASPEGVTAVAGSNALYVSRISAHAQQATVAVIGEGPLSLFEGSGLSPIVPMADNPVPGDTWPVSELTPHTVEATLDDRIAMIADSAARRVSILDRRHGLTDAQRSEMFFSYAQEFAQRQGVLAAAGATTDPGSGLSSDPSTLNPTVSSSDMDETVYELLTEEQQEEYVDAAVDRDLWWSEIIGILATDVGGVPDGETASESGDASVSSVAASSTTDETPAAVDANPHPGGNLFDLLTP